MQDHTPVDLFCVMLAAVGCEATELVAQYYKPLHDLVRGVCAGETVQLLDDDLNEEGPGFDDPFDPVDYPVPDDGCAQQ